MSPVFFQETNMTLTLNFAMKFMFLPRYTILFNGWAIPLKSEGEETPILVGVDRENPILVQGVKNTYFGTGCKETPMFISPYS